MAPTQPGGSSRHHCPLAGGASCQQHPQQSCAPWALSLMLAWCRLSLGDTPSHWIGAEQSSGCKSDCRGREPPNRLCADNFRSTRTINLSVVMTQIFRFFFILQRVLPPRSKRAQSMFHEITRNIIRPMMIATCRSDHRVNQLHFLFFRN